jgi:hypothetical protein
VVAPPDPDVAVGRLQQGGGLGSVQVRDDAAMGALVGYRQYPLDRGGMSRLAVGGVAEERPDCRQPGIAGPHAVAALVLEVLEEGADQLGIEILEPEA